MSSSASLHNSFCLQMTSDVDRIEQYDHQTLIFYVNGKRIEEKNVDPKMTLANYLRDVCECFLSKNRLVFV